MNLRCSIAFTGAFVAGWIALLAFADGAPEVRSRAYKGHERDKDVANFVAAYPGAAGTRLDDCVLCHKGAEVERKGKKVLLNACDYCHDLHRAKQAIAFSLNPYGQAYAGAGATAEAVTAVAALDSDADGSSNADEIRQGFFPGNPGSRPGNPPCPYQVLTREVIEALPAHTEFLLVNKSKQQYDTYESFTGVRLDVLLAAAGVDLAGASGITVFAPDGYAKTFAMDDVTREFPASIYYAGLDDATLGNGNGFVVYPKVLPYPDLASGAPIPCKQFLLLGYANNGEPIPASFIDADLRLEGQGPYRIVKPQSVVSMPDRGSQFSEGHSDHVYDEAGIDHNAGDMVRGVTVIRVDPAPDGCEAFDAMNGSWAYLEQSSLVVYGHGVR